MKCLPVTNRIQATVACKYSDICNRSECKIGMQMSSKGFSSCWLARWLWRIRIQNICITVSGINKMAERTQINSMVEKSGKALRNWLDGKL